MSIASWSTPGAPLPGEPLSPGVGGLRVGTEASRSLWFSWRSCSSCCSRVAACSLPVFCTTCLKSCCSSACLKKPTPPSALLALALPPPLGPALPPRGALAASRASPPQPASPPPREDEEPADWRSRAASSRNCSGGRSSVCRAWSAAAAQRSAAA